MNRIQRQPDSIAALDLSLPDDQKWTVKGDLIRLSICSGYQACRPFLHGNQVFSDALRP